MRSRRVRRPALAIAVLASALLSAACFGGQPAAQATSTSGPAAAASSPSPGASPPAVKAPASLPSPAASPSPARPIGPEETYTVETGDTLATIAQKFYDDPTQWRKIYEANRSAIGDNPDAIKVGTQIRIPPKD